MTASDFPVGTEFFLGAFGLPVVMLPDGKVFSWYGGTAAELMDGESNIKADDVREMLLGVEFGFFAARVTEFLHGTVEERNRLEAKVVTMITEERHAAAAKAERYLAYTRPLSVEEQTALAQKLTALFAMWGIVGETSIFPAGTRFFVKGSHVPVAVLPKYEGSSWYGGVQTKWDNDRLMFAMHESKEAFDEVPFDVFARMVAESIGSTVDKNKLFEEEIAPLLEKLKADREEGMRCPPVSHDDYMYCRPDVYGIWRDSDGDPI